jgi:hypothetical protein
MMLELTKEEAAVARKIIKAVHSLPCCIDEFAGLTNVEYGRDAETGDELDDCPLWSLEEKLKNA